MKNIVKFLFVAIHVGLVVACSHTLNPETSENSNSSIISSSSISSQTQNSSLFRQIEVLQPQSQEDIKKLAKQQTIFITKAGATEEVIGSGVIIGKQNKLVFILTARHIIGFNDQSYWIYFNDSRIPKIQINGSNFSRFVKYLGNNYDLAILIIPIEFDFDFDDKVAKITTSAHRNMSVFLYGNLSCQESNYKNLQTKEQFTIGTITKVDDHPSMFYGLQGFDISHNANTISGLSGSPIYDSFGRVIGIHAKTNIDKTKSEIQKSINGCHTLPKNSDSNFGRNYATSIKVFSTLFSELPESLKKTIKIDEPQIYNSPIAKKTEVFNKKNQSAEISNQLSECQAMFKPTECP